MECKRERVSIRGCLVSGCGLAWRASNPRSWSYVKCVSLEVLERVSARRPQVGRPKEGMIHSASGTASATSTTD